MEITTVFYRQSSQASMDKHTGPVIMRTSGVVLIFSPKSQTLIPWHNIERIEQTFGMTSGLAAGELQNKQLSKIVP